MPGLFIEPSDRNVQNAILLSKYNQESFLTVSAAHNDLIKSCTIEVSKRLKTLHAIDKKIFIGAALTVAAFGLSFIFPLSLVITAGLAFTTYQLASRREAYKEHKLALENLVNCCNWALNDDSIGHDLSTLKNHDSIKAMVKALAPLTKNSQLQKVIPDSQDDDILHAAEVARKDTMVMDHKLSEKEANLYYKMYGFQQGGYFAIFEGMGYAIANAWTALKSKIMPESTKNDIAPSFS